LPGVAEHSIGIAREGRYALIRLQDGGPEESMKIGGPELVVSNDLEYAVFKNKGSRAMCPKVTFSIILGLTILIQFSLLALSFPLKEVFTEKPLFYSDAGYHWYQMKLATDLATTSNIVGYDPYFNAGYAGGFTYDPSSRGAMILGILLHRWLDEVVTYKLFAFVSALIAPACVTLALWLLEYDSVMIGVGTILGLFLWWTSLFRWYHTSGMVSFVLCAYLTLPYLVLVFRYLTKPNGFLTLATLTIVGALGFAYHPFFPVPVSVGVLVYLIVCWDLVQWQRLSGLAFVGFVAVAANMFWLIPTQHYAVLNEFRAFYQSIFDPSMVWHELLGQWKGHAQGSKEYSILALTALWGWISVDRQSDRKLIRAITVTAVFLIIFAAVGGYFAIIARALQPNRFAPVGYLYLLVPSTYGLQQVLKRFKAPSSVMVSWLAKATLAIVVLGGVYLANEVRREVSYANIPHYGIRPPEVNGIGEYSQWVMNWLANSPTQAGRVLFETSKARIYDGSRMAGYYAYQSGLEFVGGPYPYLYFAGFWDGYLFDKPINSIDHDQFEKYLNLYNIGWILVHSDESKKYFDNYPGAVVTGTFQQLKGYRLERPLTYFAEGTGRVERREHNKLVLSDVSGPDAVIKYHFVDGLRSDPPTTLLPVKMLDDPTPFVKIVNSPRNIQIFMP
jgi:hypothetical protein